MSIQHKQGGGGANIVDTDQTAPISGFTLFISEASNSLVDDKNTYILWLCALRCVYG